MSAAAFAIVDQPHDIQSLRTAFAAQEQVECPMQHEVRAGMYYRRTFIPAGTIVIGRRHKKASLNLLLSGSVVLIVPDRSSGEPRITRECSTVALSAPESFFGPANEQKVAYAITDVICANVFSVDAVDAAAAAFEVFEP